MVNKVTLDRQPISRQVRIIFSRPNFFAILAEEGGHRHDADARLLGGLLALALAGYGIRLEFRAVTLNNIGNVNIKYISATVDKSKV